MRRRAGLFAGMRGASACAPAARLRTALTFMPPPTEPILASFGQKVQIFCSNFAI